MFKYFLFSFFCVFSSVYGIKSDKWIVVTTIQYPTEPLKKLASIPDWHLLVIGDKKTPKDWHLDNCEYLSPEKQLELGYEITKLLPWNHYSRKNIGYLYAIQHGAQIIYETDDDNYLIEGVQLLPEETSLLEIDSSELFVNPYAYFDQPSVWPRGYPLQSIKNSSQIEIKLESKKKIGIQQGIVNKDPDVDAIFRLTRDAEIYFNDKEPCSIPRGKFSPFNTQNTTFYKSVFWGLYIPSTTAFRVCDIWRGYIVQRLLWDVGQSLCFTRATAIQERNEHNYFHDFLGEQDLYLKIEGLAKTLTSWQSKSIFLEEDILSLYSELSEKEYLKREELALITAWIHDLKKMGYPFLSESMVGDL